MSTALPPKISAWLLRAALAVSFLSAVADRFGFWGAPGQPQVVWGAWQPFVDYTGVLLFYLPPTLVTASATLATVAEVVLAAHRLAAPASRLRQRGVAGVVCRLHGCGLGVEGTAGLLGLHGCGCGAQPRFHEPPA